MLILTTLLSKMSQDNHGIDIHVHVARHVRRGVFLSVADPGDGGLGVKCKNAFFLLLFVGSKGGGGWVFGKKKNCGHNLPLIH